MEGAYARQEKVFPSMPFRKFDRCFCRFGSTVAEEYLLIEFARSDFAQLFSQFNNLTAVEVGVGVVDELLTLASYGFDNFRMAVTDVYASYPRVEVDVLVAI